MPEKILGITRISPKYQITIPKDAREKFKLKIGDRIIFTEEEGKLILKKG